VAAEAEQHKWWQRKAEWEMKDIQK
jgi:hypothetical protein